MKSQIFTLIALIVLFTAGSFSSLAQNNRTSSVFAIDKNITSFAVDDLVDKIIYEYAPYPNYGGYPEAWSPHEWSITLIMAEGTDVTSLAPVITLAPGAVITSKHAGVQDFSRQVDYTVICEDGSKVTYSFLAYAQNNTRTQGTISVSYGTGGWTYPSGSVSYDDYYPFYCSATPDPTYSFDCWYVNGSKVGNGKFFNDYISLDLYGNGTLRAVFVTNMQYTVFVESEDNTKGTVSGGGGPIPYGSGVSVSATPKPGFAFEGWYLLGSKIPGAASFTYYPSSNCTLYARFIQVYTVTVQSDDPNKGYAQVQGSNTVPWGGYVDVIATPYNGYAFEGWYLGGTKQSSNPLYTHITTFDCTLIAKFVVAYTVTVQSEDTNKGTVSGGGTCLQGGYKTVSASPKSGYAFEGWYLNGSKISGSTPFNYYASATCTLIAKFTSVPVISGSTPICSGSSKSFSATNWQSGNYYWDKSSNLSWGSGSDIANFSITVTAVNSSTSGVGWVSVKNSSGTELKRYDVWVGAPQIYISGPSMLSPWSSDYYTCYATNPLAYPLNQYDWIFSTYGNWGSISWYPYQSYASVSVGAEGYYQVVGRIMNTCGWSDYYPINLHVYDYSPSPAYPNPVNDVLTIETYATANAKAQGTSLTYDVRLYDSQGNLLRQTSNKGGTVQFNVSALPDGIYYLHIYEGVSSTPEIQQIMVQH